MNFFTRQGRTLMLLAAMAVGLAGCIVDPEESVGNNNCTSSETCRQVTIGSQTWMAENLNITTSDSWCYGNSPDSCKKYGRLYDWNTALTVCPSGWHLPSHAEWDQLVTTAGGSVAAGSKLQSTSGWYNNGNGTDAFGFSALPGGFRYYSDGSFSHAGYNGYWWTATEYTSGYAYIQRMNYYNDLLSDLNYSKDSGISVRCIGD